MDWAAVTGRVVVEACSAAPEDVVLYCGDAHAAEAIAGRVGALVRRDGLSAPPPGLSIVVLHGWLRRRPPAEQRAVLAEAGRILPPRGLLVVGDVMWSLPPEMVDEPEQFGDAIEHAQTTATIERWAREAGFLPDLHRFGAGAAVLIAIKGQA